MTEGTREKPGILIIPHQAQRTVKVRAVEQARFLANLGRYRVYLLDWQPSEPSSQTGPWGLFLKCIRKAKELLQSLTIRPSITPEPTESGQTILRLTLPHALAPAGFSRWFNQRQLTKWISKNDIHIVLSSNAYHFPMPESSNISRIYDVVDDHLSPHSGPHWRQTQAFTRRELQKAHHTITISHALQTLLAKEGFPNSLRIPNGVDMAAFQHVSQPAIDTIRQRHGLHHRFVIGYIGNHGWWGGIGFLLEAFQHLRQMLPQALLLIVGPGEDLPKYQAQVADCDDIIFTGPIPPSDIAAYFHAIDLGVLPFDLCPFTHNALPLKILEYGAAQKRVIATPLDELKTLQFPHVTLLEANPHQWANAMAELARNASPWPLSWDAAIAAYDWRTVLAPLDTMISDDLDAHAHAPAL